MLVATIPGKTALIYSVVTIYLGLRPRIIMQFHKGSTTISIFYPSIFRPRSIETAVQEEFIYKVENEIKKI